MQISQVQIGNYIYPLTEGQPLPVKVGDTIRVFFAFNYKVPQRTDVRIWASVYEYYLGVLNRLESAQTKGVITLEQTLEWEEYEGTIDITIGSDWRYSNGTNGIIVELKDYDISDKIDDCLEVAVLPSVWDMLPSLIGIGLMVGVMTMITPIMKEES